MLPETGIRSSSCLDDAGLFTGRQFPVIRKAGFNLVELNLNHPWTGLDYKNERLISELCLEAETNSVRLTAHAPEEIQLTEFHKSGDENIICAYSEMIERISGCGIFRIVLHPCTGNSSVSERNNKIRIRNLVSRLEKILPVCERKNMVLLLETMVPGRVSSSMDTLIRVTDEVNSPSLKICLDTNHLNLSEDICAAAERAGERIGEIHLNDNHGLKEEHLLPYSGTIDWESFTEALSAISYSGDMILEPSWLADGRPYKPHHTALMLEQAKIVADRIPDSLSAIFCGKKEKYAFQQGKRNASDEVRCVER